MSGQADLEQKARAIFDAELRAGRRSCHRVFVFLLLLQWVAAIAAALFVTPRTWIGPESTTHVHVWVALLGGGLLAIAPIWMIVHHPDLTATRHVIAIAQAVFSSVLIHLTGGRIETHFHIFGSLAFLAFYRDPAALLTMTAVVALDHFLRGVFWPQSVFGILSASSWRWLEHAGWVLFEDFFLLVSIRQSDRMARRISLLRANLAAEKDCVEQQVRERTRELVVARRAAEASAESKSQFLANMSHEIRTPMTAILGFTEILADPDCEPTIRAEAVGTIDRCGRHLLTIINDILHLAKIESGSIETTRIETGLAEVVRDLVTMLEPTAAARGLTFIARAEGPVPATIETDPTRLRQVLVNLLGNAIKFTEQGGVELVVRLEDDRAGDPRLAFEVRDTGIGMDRDDLERIFEAFSQVDDSLSRRFGGTGLGLAISRRLATLLGGDLAAESTAGVGSTFTLRIDPGPIDRSALVPSLGAAAPAAAPSPEPAEEFRGDRVLLVDDGPDNRRLLAFHLEKLGLDVPTAEDGRAAAHAWAAAQRDGRPFALVLMDVQMPVMDGAEATRRLRSLGARIPIVALTAHAMADDRDRCLGYGCDDHATKPISRRELAALAARWLPASRRAA